MTNQPSRFEMGSVIAARLRDERGRLSLEFRRPGRVSSFVLDDLLPAEWAEQIHAAFPDQGRMRFNNSIKERKHVSAQMNEHPAILEDSVYAFQQPEVVSAIAEITGLRSLEPDPELYAGGISAMGKGSYLKPHLDNSHDAAQNRYRALNLLYYVTPNWLPEYGGEFELWDDGPRGRPRPVVCQFNRLVVMVTNRSSWHSVNEVTADMRRCCVSNYFFSSVSPDNCRYFHATSFRGRPREVIGDLYMRADNAIRSAILRATGTKIFKNPHIYRRD